MNELIDNHIREYHQKIEDEIRNLLVAGHKVDDLQFVVIQHGQIGPEWLEKVALRRFDFSITYGDQTNLIECRYVCNKKDVPNE